MDNCKKFINKIKKLSIPFLILGIILLIAAFCLITTDYYIVGIVLFSILPIFIFVGLFLLIGGFSLGLKEYEYEYIKIGVYAGFKNHYLFINDEIVDEMVVSFTLSPIVLKSDYLQNDIVATITIDNSINLKVNGKHIMPV